MESKSACQTGCTTTVDVRCDFQKYIQMYGGSLKIVFSDITFFFSFSFSFFFFFFGGGRDLLDTAFCVKALIHFLTQS